MADREVRVALTVTGTQQFQRAMQQAAQSTERASDATSDLGSNASGTATSLNGAIGKLRQMAAQAQQAEKLLAGPPEQLEYLARTSGKSVDQVRDDLGKLVRAARDAGAGVSDLQQQIAEQAGAAGDAMHQQSKAVEKLSEVAKGALVGVGIGMAAALVSAAKDVEPARKKLAAQMRLTPAEQQQINASADALYRGNYAGSIEEAGEALHSIIGNFREMRSASEAELTALGQKVTSVAALTGEEIGQVARVGQQLVRDGLAKDATEAFDLLAAASQNTSADMQGDLLEVASEYSKHFATMGISGSEALKLISDASEGGAIQMDKVGDAVKELGIRATDMSTASVAAYQAAGLDAATMADKILKGGDTAREGFDQIVDGLLAIPDPTARANAAIGLFGTPIEDLSVDQIPAFLTSLKNMDDGLGDVAGRATEAGNTMADSLSSKIQTALQDLTGQITTLAEKALPVLHPIADGLGDVAGAIGYIISAITGFDNPVATITIGLTGLAILLPRLSGLLSGFAARATTAGKAVYGALGPLGLAFGAVAVAVGIFSSSQADAQAAADETRAKMDDLAGTLEKVTGGFTGATTAKLTDELAGSDEELRNVGTSAGELATLLTSTGKDGGAAMRQLKSDIVAATNIRFDAIKLPIELDTFGRQMDRAKVSSEEWQNAIVRGGAELDAVRAKFSAAGENMGKVTQAETFYREELLKRSPALKTVVDAENLVTGATDSATSGFKRLTDAAAAEIKFDPTKLNEGLVAAAKNGTDTRSALEGLGIVGPAADSVMKILGDSAIKAGENLDGTATSTAAVGTAAAGAAPPVDQMAAALQAQADATKEADDSATLLDGTLRRLRGETVDGEQMARENAAALRDLGASAREVEQAQADLADKTRAVEEISGRKTKTDAEAATKARDLAQAERDKADAADAVRDAQDGQFDAQNKVYDSAVKVTDAAYQSTLKTRGQTAAVEAAAGAMQRQRDAFIAGESAADRQSGAAARLADKLGLIPRNVRTSYSSNAYEQEQVVDRLATKLLNINGRTFTVYVNQINRMGAAGSGQGYAPGIFTGGLINTQGGVRRFSSGGPEGMPFLNVAPPASRRDDNLLALDSRGKPLAFRGDEFIVNPEGSRKNRKALWYINSGGTIPGFATGGLPPGYSLAGRADPSYSGAEAAVRSAIAELAAWVDDWATRAKDSAETAANAAEAWRDANRQVDAARHDRDAATSQARADIAAAERERVKAVQVRRAAQSAADKADAAAAKKRTADTVKAAQEAAKDLTKARSEENEQIRSVAAAQRAYNRARSEGADQVRAAVAEAKTAEAQSRTAAANAARDKDRAAAAAAEEKRQKTQQRQQVLLAQQLDRATAALASAQERVKELRQQFAGFVEAGKSEALTIGPGLLGDSSFTGGKVVAGDLIRSQGKSLSLGASYGRDLAKVAKLGLNSGLLEQLKGDERGRMILAGLAGASPNEINTLNRQYAALIAQGAQAGTIRGNVAVGKDLTGAVRAETSAQSSVRVSQQQADAFARAMLDAYVAAGNGTTTVLSIPGTSFNQVVDSRIEKNNASKGAKVGNRKR